MPLLLSLLLSLPALNGCVGSHNAPQEPDKSLPAADTGVPAQLYRDFHARHDDTVTGLRLVKNNREGLLFRLAMISQATSSIDMQYFVWSRDTAGRLVFSRLLRAAKRGVRIRILVDDLDLAVSDAELATFSEHPNFEIRIYNPRKARNVVGQSGEWFTNFANINKRMHNKLMIVDGRIAVVGGRNIGNHYFGLEKSYNFVDLGAVATGAILDELIEAYDEYWNHPTAVPASSMTGNRYRAGHEKLAEDRLEHIEQIRDIWGPSFGHATEQSAAILLALSAEMIPVRAIFLQDEPESLSGEEYRLLDLVRQLLGPSDHELLISTPYLIPNKKEILDSLKQLSDKGVRVRLITNSLGSNNHTTTHSHYKKFRYDLLDTGLELYELNFHPSAELQAMVNTPPIRASFVGLHAKAFVSDRELCFLGTLNLDPRAVEINSENGMLIDSPEFCSQLAETLLILTEPENSWQVFYDEQYRLRWRGANGEVLITQPARTFGNRVADFFFRMLPIESLL